MHKTVSMRDGKGKIYFLSYNSEGKKIIQEEKKGRKALHKTRRA